MTDNTTQNNPAGLQSKEAAYQERLTQLYQEIDRINREYEARQPGAWRRLDGFHAAPNCQPEELSHVPMLELGVDHQLRICGLAGDGTPLLWGVQVVREVFRSQLHDLVMLTTDTQAYAMLRCDFDSAVKKDLGFVDLEERLESRTPPPASIMPALEAIEQARLDEEASDATS